MSLKAKANEEILIKQPVIGVKMLLICIMTIIGVQWMMTDMYMPALPILIRKFGVSAATLNITLNAGLAATAVGTLVGGSLSDKYGRKGILIIGILLNVVFCIVCAGANSVLMLSIGRAFACLGSGFVVTVANAMIKDSFAGDTFKKAMSITQAMAIVGPILGPSIGALVINLFSWRAIFLFLGGVTLLASIPLFIAKETCPPENRQQLSVIEATTGLFRILKDKSFTLFLAIITVISLPVWACISVSSYIFIDDFGLTNTMYGVFYALSMGPAVFAPFIYIYLDKKMKARRIVECCIFVTLAAGVAMVLFGGASPVIFLLIAIPISITEGIIRPLGSIVLMNEYENQVGVVSAMTNFVSTLAGIIGTFFATLAWGSYTTGLGIIFVGCTVITIAFWICIVRNRCFAKSLFE